MIKINIFLEKLLSHRKISQFQSFLEKNLSVPSYLYLALPIKKFENSQKLELESSPSSPQRRAWSLFFYLFRKKQHSIVSVWYNSI